MPVPAIYEKDEFGGSTGTVHHMCSVGCLFSNVITTSDYNLDQSCDPIGDSLCDECGKILPDDVTPFHYFNQCDRWRTNFEKGEEHWHEMMASKIPIPLALFLLITDTSDLLDEDETVPEFVADDPEHGFYIAMANKNPVVFIAHAGFEFIFTDEGDAP